MIKVSGSIGTVTVKGMRLHDAVSTRKSARVQINHMRRQSTRLDSYYAENPSSYIEGPSLSSATPPETLRRRALYRRFVKLVMQTYASNIDRNALKRERYA